MAPIFPSPQYRANRTGSRVVSLKGDRPHPEPVLTPLFYDATDFFMTTVSQ
jgi:hypothetical protein